MLNREFVNGYLGISESYKMPARLMEILFNPSEREKIFDAFSAENHRRVKGTETLLSRHNVHRGGLNG